MSKKYQGITGCILISTVLVACSSDSDDPDLDGTYSISATALTDVDINGGTCGDGSGEMTVTEGVLGGSVLSTNGNLYDISGSVTSSGEITGGFAQSGQLVVDVVGTLDGSEGSGTWVDALECEGTWESIKTG